MAQTNLDSNLINFFLRPNDVDISLSINGVLNIEQKEDQEHIFINGQSLSLAQFIPDTGPSPGDTGIPGDTGPTEPPPAPPAPGKKRQWRLTGENTDTRATIVGSGSSSPGTQTRTKTRYRASNDWFDSEAAAINSGSYTQDQNYTPFCSSSDTEITGGTSGGTNRVCTNRLVETERCVTGTGYNEEVCTFVTTGTRQTCKRVTIGTRETCRYTNVTTVEVPGSCRLRTVGRTRRCNKVFDRRTRRCSDVEEITEICENVDVCTFRIAGRCFARRQTERCRNTRVTRTYCNDIDIYRDECTWVKVRRVRCDYTLTGDQVCQTVKDYRDDCVNVKTTERRCTQVAQPGERVCTTVEVNREFCTDVDVPGTPGTSEEVCEEWSINENFYTPTTETREVDI